VPVESPALVAAGYHTSTTGAVSSTEFDPRTGDVVLDANGSETGMSDTAQRVYFCLKTIRGSRISTQEFGLTPPASANDTIQPEVYEFVRVALQPVITDRSVRLDSVDVEVNGTSVYALVTWTDLRRRTQHTSTAPIGR
jgi:hypothetical protein